MDPIEGWMTLILFIVLIIILGYGWFFDRLPEPVMGWQCIACDKKVIGMKTSVKTEGWDLSEDDRHICPDCQSPNINYDHQQ